MQWPRSKVKEKYRPIGERIVREAIVKDKLQGNLLFIKEKLAERILELKLEAQRDKFLNPKKKRK